MIERAVRTSHVDRGEFDKMMFDNAAEKGAVFLDGTRVVDLVLAAEQGGLNRATLASLLAVRSRDRIDARVVVDATGQQSLIANKLGLKTVDPDLKKAAVWGYFENAERDEAGGGVKTIILQTESKQAWFWYIPLANNLTSVGVVADRDYLLKGRGSRK